MLSRRWPRSGVRGGRGTLAAVVLRTLVLKHLYDWSSEECEREVRGGLVYRAFCPIDGEGLPHHTTLIRLAQALGTEVLKGISLLGFRLGVRWERITGTLSHF